MCTHTSLDKNQVNKEKQTNILELFAHTKKKAVPLHQKSEMITRRKE